MIRLSIVAIITLTVPLSAQWVHYPTPGIPRTPDDKPNLAAPAPQIAGGKPDFSGLWEKNADKFYNNIAADLKPDEVQPWAEALYQQRKKDFGKDSMETKCLPFGPAYTTTPYREHTIIQMPALIVILNSDLTYRRIFMDRRQRENDPNPTWMGYSVGHWDGDTLVVESNGFSESTWLDVDGHPHTEALRMTERYRRPDFGHINLQITLDDPKAYAKPWTVTVTMDLEADAEMLESACQNERDSAHIFANAKGDALNVSTETLAAYAGTYDVQAEGKTLIVEVKVDSNTLLWNYDGTGTQKLDPVSASTFSLAGTLIEFVRDAQGRVTHFLIRMVEEETRGIRRN